MNLIEENLRAKWSKFLQECPLVAYANWTFESQIKYVTVASANCYTNLVFSIENLEDCFGQNVHKHNILNDSWSLLQENVVAF